MTPRTFVLLLMSFFLSCFPARAEEPLYDYVIRGALVYDGVHDLPEVRDVAIRKSKISAVGKVEQEGATEISAQGKVLMPGFIDAHTHSDFNPLVYEGLGNKVRQGVTTEVVGNCGMSAIPLEGQQTKEIEGVWAREGVPIPHDLEWSDLAGYRAVLERAGMDNNFAVLVGHGNLRGSVMGFSDKKPADNELKAMESLLRDAMREGAAGLSFGLVYLPGIYADEAELVSLCSVVAEFSGVCAFHMRSESGGLEEAVREVLRVGEASGARIEISHLKASGRGNWAKIDRVFRMIEEAREAGLEVRADAYPYEAGFAELGVTLPDALYKSPDRLARLRNPARRKSLIDELKQYSKERGRSWSSIRLAAGAPEAWQGKSIQELAEAKNTSPEALVVDLLADKNFEVSAFYFSQSPEIVSRVLSKPYVSIGSDSIADGSLFPHPRVYGTVPKLMETMWNLRRDEFGSWVRKNTADTARFFSISDRGSVTEGQEADLVLMNPETLKDRASYAKPAQVPSGIDWVFVSGVPVVADGHYSPSRAGHVLNLRR